MSKCRNCSKEGGYLFECTGCGKQFCSKCGDSGYGDVCPKCDGTGRRVSGH